MCGLSGVVGNIGRVEEDIFKDLLVFNTVRGADSTGAASIPRYANDDINVVKIVGPAADLLRSTTFMKMMHPSHCVLLGHNRSMTRGSVKWRNAHPFIFKNTVGMHNGTLMSVGKLKDGHKYETDSEAIIHSIDEVGPEETIPLLEGSYTLIWYDKNLHAVNMIRNEERPLFYCLRDDGKALVFASELGILKAAVHRDGSRPFKEQKFMMLPTDVLYTWEIPDNLNDAFKEPLRKKLEGFKRPVSSGPFRSSGGSGNSTHTPFRGNTNGTSNGGTGSTGTTSTPSNRVGPSEVSQPNSGKVLQFPTKASYTLISDGEFKGWHMYIPGDKHRVFRDPERNCWVECTWNGLTQDWDRTVRKFAPASVQIPHIHKGDHRWKHRGKKKKKVIYFRGWGGHELNRVEFEAIMAFGCQACHRHPEWGHDITFLNEHYDFLCGLCALDKPLLDQWRQVS